MANMTSRPRAFLLTLTLFFALGSAAELQACSCVVGSPKSAFQGSDDVFLGEVLDSDGFTARMRPIESFKGARHGIVKIVTDPEGSACGYGWALEVGSRHLIYGYRETVDDVRVSLCSRTAREESAACDLSLLRSRARWWKTRLSSVRLFQWIHIRWRSCQRW
jgi:hypothetical protein